MRVVLTRPATEAARWAEALRARGHEVLELPLLAIEPLAQTRQLTAAWHSLESFQAAMFVSGQSVLQFRRAAPAHPWPPGTRAWSTGPGTSAALRRAGVPESLVDAPSANAASFDSEALWTVVQEQVRAGLRVLVVRGADAQGQASGRDWLARQLETRGAVVDQLAAYRRVLPPWTPGDRAAAATAAEGAIWLLSSSEGIANLASLLPGTDWSGARAVATHERIAQSAREAGFGVVWLSRPSLEAVTAALESIR